MGAAKYCTESFFADGVLGALASARIVVPILLDLMAPKKPQSAVDFGCGLGAWLKALQESGVSSVSSCGAGREVRPWCQQHMARVVRPKRHALQSDYRVTSGRKLVLYETGASERLRCRTTQRGSGAR
jgi:hypothetical protein